MIQPTMFPIAVFQECHLDEANALLVRWEHRMGALERPMEGDKCYALVHESTPIAVATHSTLIRDHAGGGLDFITRENGIELSRLCAARAGLCRVMIRLWRELVFPTLGRQYAISYQDADLHQGHTYRFDGWKRSPRLSRSGTDARAKTEDQRQGRDKWLWYWENAA